MKINNEIRAPKVRLVGDNVSPGIYSLQDAKKIAQDQELDLVMVSENADPPVCKVIDQSKALYEAKQKEKNKPKPKPVKEIQFTSNIDSHDLQTKANHAEDFLKKGHKVRVALIFKGRNIEFVDRGKLVLLQFLKMLEEFGTPDRLPAMEGKRMIVHLNPKKQ